MNMNGIYDHSEGYEEPLTFDDLDRAQEDLRNNWQEGLQDVSPEERSTLLGQAQQIQRPVDEMSTVDIETDDKETAAQMLLEKMRKLREVSDEIQSKAEHFNKTGQVQ